MALTLENSPDTDIKSLPADSSWLTFIQTAFFGKNYFTFRGRASRSEYWAVFLFYVILSSLLDVGLIYFNISTQQYEEVRLVFELLIFLPFLTLYARRFHDFNMRAWWIFAIFPCLLLPFFKGNRHDNRFGKNIYNTEL